MMTATNRSNTSATCNTGTWATYTIADSSGTTGIPYYMRRHVFRPTTKPEFNCYSCKTNYHGKGKTHPDYPEVLVCDKCIKERNKHLMLVMDEERI